MPAETTISSVPWGRTHAGVAVDLYTLASATSSLTLSTFGAAIIGWLIPDRDGKLSDVVLGHSTLAACEADRETFFGATIGRFANRIAAGRFTLDGVAHQVPCNNAPNALHGGPDGFDRQVWTATQIPNGVEMTLRSPDGDMGFPGQLDITVRFTLTGNRLHIAYTATTTEPTVLNLTNHTYFNLAGESSGTVLDQQIRIAANAITPIREDLIPTGDLLDVTTTPFDLRQSTRIGAHIGADDVQLQRARGYDHNFVLGPASQTLRVAAEAHDPSSGRTLTVHSTEPGVQFYTGNFLDGTIPTKSGVGTYAQRSGFCLETQHFPDSPNQPHFPSTVLRPGETFHSETVFSF